MNAIRKHWAKLAAFACQDRLLVGASVFRVIAGVTILFQYLVNYRQRHYLFGPGGAWPYEYFLQEAHGSLYAWSASPWFFEVCFHLGVVVAILWALGWRTRYLTPVHFYFWYSLHQRFPGLWDGGDNVMQLVFVYALFADLNAHLSFDSPRRRDGKRSLGDDVRAICHSAAMLAFALQICLVYGIAGLTKVQGETWRNGTALYYALRAAEFTWPGHSELIFHNSILLTILAYATVAFQIAFTFLLFGGRTTRTLAVLCGLTFHVGIALYMGLVSFAGFLIAVDLSLIADEEYRTVASWARMVAGKAHQAWAHRSAGKEARRGAVQAFATIDNDIRD